MYKKIIAIIEDDEICMKEHYTEFVEDALKPYMGDDNVFVLYNSFLVNDVLINNEEKIIHIREYGSSLIDICHYREFAEYADEIIFILVDDEGKTIHDLIGPEPLVHPDIKIFHLVKFINDDSL